MRGLLRLFEVIIERAQEEYCDKEAVAAELMDLHKRFEAGCLTEEMFEQREGELVRRLEEIQQREAASQAPPNRA